MDDKLRVFVKQIRDIAEFLKPHIDDKKKGIKIWNGKKYAEYRGEEYEGDSYARVWFSTLIVLAEMIDRQESNLTTRQREFISTLLFGGMGSFNDYSFKKAFRMDIYDANQMLDKLRGNLFATFKQLNVT